jgi:hypothetical protein
MYPISNHVSPGILKEKWEISKVRDNIDPGKPAAEVSQT